MNKRVFTIIIALLLAAFGPKAYGQAGDSADNPIEISDYNGLVSMKLDLTKYYKLTEDITIPEDKTWVPPTGAFTGTFDGGGYTISGLKVSVDGDAGLFEAIGTSEEPGGIVKNLGVKGTVTSTDSYAGGIAGKNFGTIQNCYTSVEVTVNGTGSYVGAGGIAGFNNSTIKNCYTTGAVTNEKGRAGGIAGYHGSEDGNTIQYCYATGAIKGNQAGGIAGESGDLFISYGNILNCITLNNSITDTTSVGRIVGSKRKGTLTANYAAPSIPGAWVDDKDGAKKNGIDLTEDNFIKNSAFESAGAFYGWNDNNTTNWAFGDNTNLPQVNTDGGTSISGQTASKPRADYLEAPVTTITTKDQLADIKKDPTGSYKLGGNITLTDANGDAWTPIAGEFTGTLDGCGYTISGLKVSVTGKAGLFEAIGAKGIVKNLGVTGTTVTATSTNAGGYAGGIAGYSEGTIQNCYTNVAVTAASSTDGAGGIVGNNDGTIKNCYTTGAVTNEAGYAGGIAGKNTKDIQYCYATGIIKGSKAGGITGENSLNTRYCIALNGSITGTTSAGRIAGGTSTGVFATNHAAPSIPGAWEDKGANKMDGTDLTAISFTAAIATAFTGWNEADWDFSTAANLPILMGFKTANQPVKDVARAPFLEVPVTTITTQAELAAIKDNLAGSYKLGNDITLTGDWAPLGEFTGTLDGCGFTISKLKVSVNDNAGLFETIGTGGTVKNLGVTDGSVTSAYASAGSIASENRGTIQNCYTNVTVTANAPWGGGGGIAGENNKGIIKNCYTTGAVTNERGSAGGIAGMSSGNDNFTPIPIQYCYATGVIKGNKAGGIIGQNGSNMGQTLNCIALNDSIIGTNNAPQVGRIAGATIGTFTANHAAISIPGTWAAAADKGADKKNGADLTENTFTGASATAFTSWNTTTDWDFTTAANLPILKGFKTANQPVKDKKREPFLVVPVTTIKDQAGLAAIASNLSGSYKLGGSFTLTGNWKPLGDNNNRFTGILDGCGYTISGLSVSMTETTDTYAGLFGAIGKDGTVKNLGVTGSVTVTTTGINGYAYAGGIAGLSTGKIMNCYTNVTVDAKGSIYTYAGGIVGYFSNADPAISNCFATGNCTATGTDSAAAGGILGGNNGKGAIISYCFATGTIEAKGATEFKYAGGIAGQSGTTMTGCIALNKGITGASGKTNRIAGNHYASTITDCYASPAIPGTWNETGADKPNGADLTSANFINSNDAFTDWVPDDWRLGDNWQFEDKDFANLPTLLTNGLIPEDIVLAGQTAIKRADCLGLVLIDKAVTYDANLHKDKNLVIAPTGNLTVNTANAQVSSLEIQPDGQVTTTTALGVTKAISTSRTLENQWSTFGAPVAMTFKAIETAYKLEGYASSEAQRWTRFNLPSSAVSLTAASPNLLAIDKGSETVSFSSDNGTSIPVSAKAESGTTLSNGIFLFRTNPSLSNQTVTNAYILSDDGTRFELQDTAYTLKPFECYVIANAATTKAVQSLRVANGIPTGNDPITLPSDAFRLWEADGQLHLEASQPTDVQVYTLTGTLAHSFRLDGSRTLTLPRGIYLVRSNNITYKVSL